MTHAYLTEEEIVLSLRGGAITHQEADELIADIQRCRALAVMKKGDLLGGMSKP